MHSELNYPIKIPSSGSGRNTTLATPVCRRRNYIQYAARDAVATLDVGLEWSRRSIFCSSIVNISEVFRNEENR